MKYDFEKASIRKIALKANTSKSNIYNYFENKDELFCTVLKPTMDTINHAFEFKNKEYAGSGQQMYNFDNQKKIIEIIMTFIYQHKDDFILLLFKSKGSLYESFREDVKKIYTDIMISWLSLIANDKEISRFFIASIADLYINTISQMILKELSAQQVQQYFDEFLLFVYGGWEKILNSGGNDE